jgi:hypothetical protein
MKKRVILPILGAFLTGSMACSAIPFLAPTATPTVTLTPTMTPTLTSTATLTSTPTSTRTLTPTKITGIEAPVMIGDAELQFQKALRRSNFVCGTTTQPVDNPNSDEYLLVTAKVSSGPTINIGKDGDDWVSRNGIDRIETTDAGNHFYDITGICYNMDNSKVLTQVALAFVIHKDAESFVLILPDDTHIPLDPIL